MSIFPTGWQVEPLSEVCDEIVDCLNKTATVVDGPTPYKMIRTTNVKDGRVNLEETRFVDEVVYRKWTRRFKPRRGDVILTREAPLGEVGLLRSDEHVFLGQRTMAYRTNPKRLDQRFLYYSLLGPTLQAQIRMYGAGSTVEHMRVPQAESLQIPFPDLASQQKIAAILAAYDDLIANNQRRITLLERMAEDIYREWFVRLRFPGHKQVKIEKGVPQGWDFDSALKFFGHAKGKSYGGDELTTNPQHMPFITLKSFNRGGGYRADGLKYYSGRFKPEQIVNCGDVVMAVTDMTQNREVVGRVARVPAIGDRGAVISLDVIKLTPKTISASFLYSYMRLSGFGGYIKEFANGTNVLHLKPDLVTQQKILMPATGLQTRFTRLANPIYSQIDALNLTIAKLESTRDALLPRLISGKLAVDGLAIRFPPGMASSLDKNQ